MAESNSTGHTAPKKIGRPPVDYTGRTIGVRYVLGKDLERSKRWKPTWIVRCKCGHVFSCLSQALTLKHCMMCAHKGPRPYRRLRPYEATYNIFRSRAKYPVSITYEQFAELARIAECHYCGEKIQWQEYRHQVHGGTGSNLDRMDSAKPYDQDNVVVCCGRCNYAKNDHFTYEEWLQIGTVIRSWRALAALEKEIEAAINNEGGN